MSLFLQLKEIIMAITIEASKFYNDLIIEAFNTKDKEESLTHLNNMAMGLGYDLYSIDPVIGYKDDNEMALYTVKLYIIEASISEKIGYVSAEAYHIIAIDKIIDLVKWLRKCEAFKSTFDESRKIVWYTTPEMKMMSSNPTLKEEVLMNIDLNNSESTSIYTTYNKDYEEMKYFNTMEYGITNTIKIESKTARSLSDIIVPIFVPSDKDYHNLVNYALQWIQSCGFVDAKIIDGNRIQLA